MFRDAHFGFGPSSSTIDAIRFCIDVFRKAVDDNNFAVCSLLNFSMAFTFINHNQLKLILDHLKRFKVIWNA